ncbi:MAG: class I SAM-dependent methyltransferase [Vulcanimicrobiaceae bacterium]
MDDDLRSRNELAPVTPEARYMERLLRKLAMNLGGRVLDLGCGNGRFTKRLARDVASVVGVDLAEHSEWRESLPENVTFRTADAERLDYPTGFFDSVLAMNILHHVDHPERALFEIKRVCRPGGSIVVIEPNRHNPLGYVHLTLLGGHEHFTTKKFRRLMDGAFGSWASRRFECHYYPFPSFLLGTCEVVEDFLERQKLWQSLLFYNAAVVERGVDSEINRQSASML